MKIFTTFIFCIGLLAAAAEPLSADVTASAKETSVKVADADAVKTGDAADTNAVEAVEKPEDPNFERYKTIMDRMPFGREPPGFDPDSPGAGTAGGAGGPGSVGGASEEAAKSEEEQRIIAAVRVSVLNVTPSGKVAVGFTDSSKQPTANYYLKVGESRDGWKVESADPVEQTVKLSHDGVEAELKLGEGSAGGDAKGKPSLLSGKGRPMGGLGLAGRRPPPVNAVPHGASEEPPQRLGPASALSRLRERRQRTEAEMAAEAERRKQAEEQEKLEKAQAAEERQQQLTQLMQIQEELKRQREEKAAAEAANQQNGDGNAAAQDE